MKGLKSSAIKPMFTVLEISTIEYAKLLTCSLFTGQFLEHLDKCGISFYGVGPTKQKLKLYYNHMQYSIPNCMNYSIGIRINYHTYYYNVFVREKALRMSQISRKVDTL